MTDQEKEFELKKLDIILSRYGGRKGLRSYLICQAIVLGVTLIGALAMWICYAVQLRK